jgi:hypothetical protein
MRHAVNVLRCGTAVLQADSHVIRIFVSEVVFPASETLASRAAAQREE